MSTNKNYWKDAYKESWEAASTKEKAIKSLIEAQTGLSVIEVGLGAGTTDYIPGSAKDHNLTKGDADLYIPEKDCYIEVTGPNIPMAFSKPLWVRPDKLQNTFQKIKEGRGKLHVVFHVLTEVGNKEVKIRIIKLDKTFFGYLNNNAFVMAYPTIRGREEKYVELPPEHEVILNLEEFFELLKTIKI